MATRQDVLFAAEDYTAVYQSFAQANFKAYDFDTIKSAMVDYIRLNYPEDYNDWIQSSEFVSLIDLIAYLGHSLAFRIDFSSRENFLVKRKLNLHRSLAKRHHNECVEIQQCRRRDLRVLAKEDRG